MADIDKFWSISAEEVLKQLKTTNKGLSSAEAKKRLAHYGPNLLKAKAKTDVFSLFISQFKSPIILILLFATVLSIFLGDKADAIIIFSIVFLSGILGFFQEKGATDALKKLLAIVQIKAEIVRDGKSSEINIEEAVPGDIVILNAGDIIPADSLIIESNNLFADEAALTGESFPAEKSTETVSADAELSKRTNCVWMGTHILSGTATSVIVKTGKDTEFGKISEHLRKRPHETEFEHGIKKFGFFLMTVTGILVVFIFIFNLLLSRPMLESFLFSLALAVGLTPQLLPAIISVNLSHGARKMAEQKVIVKRLSSIENFGSMNILCADKTGTLTEGSIKVKSGVDIEGKEYEKVLFYSYINASFEEGFTNPIDEAVKKFKKFDISSVKKVGEVPYDFQRKRLTIVVTIEKKNVLITKGSFANIMEVCSKAEKDKTETDIAEIKDKLNKQFEKLSSEGYRILAVAYKNIAAALGNPGSGEKVDKALEKDLTFLGFLLLFDPPKPDVDKTIEKLKKLGVSLKIITGDNRPAAEFITKKIGIEKPVIVTGAEVEKLQDEELQKKVNDTDVFAQIEPNLKEKIIIALRKAGNVVGYMGDGINDATALHSSDVSISVNTAVPVAKEAADVVLLKKDLDVLLNGVREGRTTFANTLKYVFMATSANFGNMFSMAGASLFLPFLPLLPKQILVTNLMTDFPEMTIASDNVDKEMIQKPRRWNIKAIRKFMLTFGLVSSIFDYITFGILLFILKASEIQFRTGWFVESVVSASMIVLVIRSRKPFFKSKPGKYLLIATILVAVITFIVPYTPLKKLFEFQALPQVFILMIVGITVIYVFTAEVVKTIFYRKVRRI